ncbi:MAG: AsmA family protein [Gammaproteobacteria bacterium]|nr:AsmA family protein [Gammaproteobacteria bacterium]
MKIIKISGIVVIVLGLLIGAALVAVSFIDINQYKGLIAEQVKEATGRELVLEGNLELKVSLSPTVVVQSARFANAAWGSRPDMLTVNRLEAEIKLIPLIRSEFQVKRFVLIEPDILLETNKDGLGNWELGTTEQISQQPLPEKEKPGFPIQVAELRVENASLSYRDGVSGEGMSWNLDRFSFKPKGDNLRAVAVELRYQDVPFKLEGTTGLIYDLLSNEPFPMQLHGVGGDVDITLEGRIDRPMEAKGIALAVGLKATQLNTLSKLIDAELPALGTIALSMRVSDTEKGYDLADLVAKVGASDLSGSVFLSLEGKRPFVKAQLASNKLDLGVFESGADKQTKQQQPKAQQKPSSTEPISLEPLNLLDADLSLKAKELHTSKLTINDLDVGLRLKNGKLEIAPLKLRFAGGSDLDGRVSVSPSGKRPLIKAKFSSNLLDLSVFEADDSQNLKAPLKIQAEKKADKLFSAEPLSLEPLHRLNIDFSLNSKKVHTRSLILDELNVTLQLRNGKLNIKPVKMNVAGGELRADIAIDASSKTTVVAANIKGDRIELGRIYQFKKLIRGGKVKVSIKLRGRGISVKGIMAGLDGRLVLDTGKGELNSAHINLLGSDLLIELVNKINPIAKKGSTSQLECAVVRFDVKDGVAVIDRGIAFQTDKMSVVGSGGIDLKEEKLDLGIKPEARKRIGIDAGQLAELVRIAGPLTGPKLVADAKGTVKLGVTIGAAVATGGVSYLGQRLLASATRDEAPCLTALGKEITQAVEPGKTSRGGSEEQEGAVKGGAKNILKGTKGLFGR